jgi:hypothetical protein
MKPGRIFSVIITIAALTLAACARNTGAAQGSGPGARQEGSSVTGVKNESTLDCQADYSMNAPKDVAMNEELKVSFTAPANHDPKGWIGIFLSGDDPEKGNPVSRQIVGAEHQCSGSVTLKGVATGEYDVYYFLDGGREKVGPRSKLTAHTPV